MQAAVVSVLLMAGVCGAPPCDCGGPNSQAAFQQSYDNSPDGCTVYDGTMYGDGMRGDRAQGGRLWSPVTADGTVTYDVACFGCPRYSPLWLIHSNATYYPANYAKPYDYREAFGYPWNGPRPLAPQPLAIQPLALQPLAQTPPMPTARRTSAANAWPAETAASYQRESYSQQSYSQQSQPRLASKPAIENR